MTATPAGPAAAIPATNAARAAADSGPAAARPASTAGPHTLAAMEWALRALDPLEPSPAAAGRAVMAVTHYLQGSVRLALSGEAADPRPSSEAGAPGAAWRNRLADTDLGAYPRPAALIDADTAAARGGRGWFMAGLELILAGVEAQAGC
ncbi:TetR/AcrR family transcriptional regulator C-terminal domain-containing protein [Nocardiopsis sp. CC223A]|uniref:TetR/AcrR family transcriptional regulator C-terminal domain-containing protein n=1 Tax=Nocardiopsis sp. CC223A TaxID=3044051 RepID=UPI00278C4090|nr:TetR/AcrR family transcriptional regulator C-terminal domain-containing protein [Nocardiopsis sp. CC223A]